MKLSLFHIGLLVSMVGIAFCAYFFIDAEKSNTSFTLDAAQTKSTDIYLQPNDIGFYKVYTPNFKGDAVFIQILDPLNNIITDKKIETKMAINYFDIIKDGSYEIKATNLSQNSIYLEIEFGQTNSKQINYPAMVVSIGIIMIIGSTYKKLKNYQINDKKI